MSSMTFKEVTRCMDKKNQVSFIIHIGSHEGSSSCSTEITKNLSLLHQKPKENVSVKFTLKCLNYSYCSNDSKDDFEYDLTLTFDNILHELSQDYGYEIDFHAYVKESNTNVFHHVPLFSHKQIRSTNPISFCKQRFNMIGLAKKLFTENPNFHSYPTLAGYNKFDTHICCNITRYNSRKMNSSLEISPYAYDLGSKLFQTGHYSDLSLIVKGKVFRVHKHVLASRSRVFQDIFSHDAFENKNDILKIDNYDAKVIEELLKYIYTGEVDTSDIPIELFKAAYKYQFLSVQEQCIEYFLFNAKNENVVDILDLASLYNLKDLEKRFLTLVRNREAQMVSEPNYQKFLCRNLKLNTIVDTLKLCEQYEVLQASIQTEVFNFVKVNNKFLLNDIRFRGLFKTHPSLMEKLYVYTHS